MNRFLFSSAVLALSAGMAQAEYKLDILHINDWHSRIESVNKYDSTCDAENEAAGECYGGAARLMTKVGQMRDEIRGAGGNVIFVSAGDNFQGSLMYSTYKGAVEAEMLEKMGVDVMMIGNHEFDDGPEGLAGFIDKVSFPVIGGNIDVSGEPSLAGKVPDHVILEVGGEKIGIVGSLTRDTIDIASPGSNITFEDEIEALKADVAAMEAEGVNKIIALTHVGYPMDLRLAEAVPGVDAVVGGHSNTYLSASDEERDADYPTMVTQADGTQVPVVQAYAVSRYLGHLELTFDDAGKVVNAGGDTIVLDASVERDPEIVARVEELAGPIEELKQKVIGASTAEIVGARDVCRVEECAMGNLVADAMLDRVKGQGVTIAIQNGGGLRASIDAGEVTMGEVLTVLPFQNTLSTFEMTGAGIVEALENGVSQVEEVAGRFPQVAGLKFTWDPAAEPGSRIAEVLVAEDNGFVPIDPDKTYGVVTNNYVRNGGDGYRVFSGEDKNAYDFGPDLADVTAEFIAAKGGEYAPYTDGRITKK